MYMSIKRITLRIPDELAEQLESLANENQNSLNSEILDRLEYSIDSKNRLPIAFVEKSLDDQVVFLKDLMEGNERLQKQLDASARLTSELMEVAKQSNFPKTEIANLLRSVLEHFNTQTDTINNLTTEISSIKQLISDKKIQ